MGSLDVCVRPRIAPRPLCAESRARSHKLTKVLFSFAAENTWAWSDCAATTRPRNSIAGPRRVCREQSRPISRTGLGGQIDLLISGIGATPRSGGRGAYQGTAFTFLATARYGWRE